jgi:predicted nucleic-acid-binding protein
VIALDTNVLVRFLVEDDPEQSRQTRAMLQRAVDGNSPCCVSEVVVCEVVWVLGTSYRVGREEIARVLRQLFRARHLTFPEGERLSRAVRRELEAELVRGPADLRRLRQHTEHAQQWLRGRIEEAARDLAQAEADRRHLYKP